MFPCYAVKTGRGVRRISDRLLRLHRFFGLRLYASLSFDLSDESALDMLKEFRPKFFCLNDTECCTDVHREKVRHILSELLDR